MRNNNAGKQIDLLPVILIIIGGVLVIGVLIWQVSRSSQAVGPVADNASGQNMPEPGIQRVTLQNAKTAFDSKSALFLDVRDPDSYKADHIPGAVNIPLGELENRMNELDKNRWIITYCT
jgi:3-mercaptopyruvate sulfurtransferase SseA